MIGAEHSVMAEPGRSIMRMNDRADPPSGHGRRSRTWPAARVALLALALAGAMPAQGLTAALERQWAWCRSDDDNLQIRGCSAVIRAGHDTPEHLARAFANRGRAWTEQADYGRAMHDLDNAIRLDPNFADAFNDRGVANVSQGRFDEAMRDFDEAIRLDPNYAIAIYNRGLALRAMGRTEEADKAFARAREVGPRLTSPDR